jgi:hypothetical protein
MATVNWTQTGVLGTTAQGWTIMPVKRPGIHEPGSESTWCVFDADGLFMGEYDTRAQAEAAAR